VVWVDRLTRIEKVYSVNAVKTCVNPKMREALDKARCSGSILSVADKCPSGPPTPRPGQEGLTKDHAEDPSSGKIETETDAERKPAGIPGNGGHEHQSPESSRLLTAAGGGATGGGVKVGGVVTPQRDRRNTGNRSKFVSWLSGLLRRRTAAGEDDDEVKRVIVSSVVRSSLVFWSRAP